MYTIHGSYGKLMGKKNEKKSDLSFQPGNDAHLSLQLFSTTKSRQNSGKCRASHVANLHDWGLLGNHLTGKNVFFLIYGDIDIMGI